jgi:hypothetical protein
LTYFFVFVVFIVVCLFVIMIMIFVCFAVLTEQAYAVWPERYYIVKDGKMVQIFSPTTDFGFDRDAMRREIEQCVTLGTKVLARLSDVANAF